MMGNRPGKLPNDQNSTVCISQEEHLRAAIAHMGLRARRFLLFPKPPY